MKKRRSLGHVSSFHAFEKAVIEFIDKTDTTGSVVGAVVEQRLDDLEESNQALSLDLNGLTSTVLKLDTDFLTVSGSFVTLNANFISHILNFKDVSGSLEAVSGNLDDTNSNLNTLSDNVITVTSDLDIVSSSLYAVSGNLDIISSSVASLSSSFTLLSASIGSGGTINVDIDEDAELIFDGDTLMTNSDVYISGSGNNLYLQGTNEQGFPAKFEFSITNGRTVIKEVPHTDFGEEVDDPWFKFDGDTLLTHADIYVTGSNNYLYLNGTDRNGDYGVFYFDIEEGQVIIKQSGSTD